MIYEFRTYDLKPRTLGQYDATLKKSLSAGRLEHSRLFGYWYSEFGLLNQALHIWPYQSLDERIKVRSDMIARKIWPPADNPVPITQANKLFMPFSFSPLS